MCARYSWGAAILEFETAGVLLIRAPVARERDVVLRVIYQMSEAQFKQYWVAKIFRAEAASPPKIVYSNDMQYELISGIPGAIGFMDARNVRPGLKVLRVTGTAGRQGVSAAVGPPLTWGCDATLASSEASCAAGCLLKRGSIGWDRTWARQQWRRGHYRDLRRPSRATRRLVFLAEAHVAFRDAVRGHVAVLSRFPLNHPASFVKTPL